MVHLSTALRWALPTCLAVTQGLQTSTAVTVNSPPSDKILKRSILSSAASAVAQDLDGTILPLLNVTQLQSIRRLVPQGAFLPPSRRRKRRRDAAATNAANQGIQNALGPSQDPSPISRIESDGQRHYYFPTADNNRGVFMQSSHDLNTVLADPANVVKVYEYPTQIQPQAPGLFQYDANTYAMYLSSVGPNSNGSLRALVNRGPSLTTGWQDAGELIQKSTGKKLVYYDAHPFNHPNGKKYILFSGNKYVAIAQLTGVTTVGSTILTFSTGVKSNRVLEAPSVHIQGSTMNLFWSDNAFFAPDYNIISAHIPTSSDPLKASSYQTFTKTKILSSSSANGVYGPGSGGTFTGPDGKPWMAYTCFYNPKGFAPDKINPRRVQAQPVVFSGSNLAKITPVAPTRFVDKSGN